MGYQGGYFKYGTLSWKQTKIEDDGITVQFTLKTAWDSAFFSRCAAARARARARARTPPALSVRRGVAVTLFGSQGHV